MILTPINDFDATDDETLLHRNQLKYYILNYFRKIAKIIELMILIIGNKNKSDK